MSSLLCRFPKLSAPFLFCSSPMLAPNLAPNQSRAFRGRSSRNSRRSGATPQTPVLLDKFVKHTKPDGSITVTAPFSLKIRGSYFDKSNNVDRERNRKATNEHRSHQEAQAANDENSSADEAVSRSVRNLSAIEDESGGGGQQTLNGADSPTTSPLHLLLYGKMNQRVDSYSIMESFRQTSHIYIADSDEDFIELETMFLKQHYMESGNLKHMKPYGSFSIFQPNQDEMEVNKTRNRVMEGAYEVQPGNCDSVFRIYCPPHLLETCDHGVRSVFLVPIVMNNIHMHGERDADIELDGRLISGLSIVDLTSTAGDIKLRDVVAKDVRISTRGGRVLSEGTLEGTTFVEVHGEGDFLAKFVEGPAMSVKTDLGDINIFGDCNTDTAHFSTAVGNIHIRYLCGNCFALVKKSGNVFLNLVEGSATVTINQGGAFIGLESVTSDSNFQIKDSGELIVTVPSRHNFRIEAAAGRLNIPPKLLNLGEIFIDEHTQKERFSCGDHRGKSDENMPVVNLESLNGAVTLVMDTDAKREYLDAYDSTT